ncbi:MAG: hypothetical protein JW818_23350 [Pirellulales bacterium]|nr:hypothetical protein [Pirellulales bacterium]
MAGKRPSASTEGWVCPLGWMMAVGLLATGVSGCSSTMGPAPYKWSAAKDAKCREAAARDSFPTAAQAGISSVRHSTPGD